MRISAEEFKDWKAFELQRREKPRERITIKRRKLVQIGGTFYVSLPKSFVRNHGLGKGSEVAIVANDRLQVVVP